MRSTEQCSKTIILHSIGDREEFKGILHSIDCREVFKDYNPALYGGREVFKDCSLALYSG